MKWAFKIWQCKLISQATWFNASFDNSEHIVNAPILIGRLDKHLNFPFPLDKTRTESVGEIQAALPFRRRIFTSNVPVRI